jgi:hypothetical protein
VDQSGKSHQVGKGGVFLVQGHDGEGVVWGARPQFWTVPLQLVKLSASRPAVSFPPFLFQVDRLLLVLCMVIVSRRGCNCNQTGTIPSYIIIL